MGRRRNPRLHPWYETLPVEMQFGSGNLGGGGGGGGGGRGSFEGNIPGTSSSLYEPCLKKCQAHNQLINPL